MAPRTTEERVRDAKRVLEAGGDAWVATATVGPGQHPHLVVLSFAWDGKELVFCTEKRGMVVGNVGEARVGIGPTRDVLMLHGQLWLVGPVQYEDATAELFAAATGWDPREDGDQFVFLRFRPRRAMAWREADEIAGRTIMRDGVWSA